jgi:hypothetical protein
MRRRSNTLLKYDNSIGASANPYVVCLPWPQFQEGTTTDSTMAGSEPVSPARHLRNTVDGRQRRRRRITRRSNMPRSNTTPELGGGVSAMASGAGAVTADLRMLRAIVKNEAGAGECFPLTSDVGAFGHSPTTSIRSGLSTITQRKKKHGMLGFKSKDNDRPKSSHGSPLQLSPLPPLTPVKAAQFLGVECGAVRTRSGSLDSRVQGNDELGDLPVRSARTMKLLYLH